MKVLLLRLGLLLVLALAFIGGNVLLDALDRDWKKPRTLVFELPLPPDIEKKYDIDESDFPVEKVVAAGFFSDWDPANGNYRMEKTGANRWSITLPLDPGENQYKFVVYTASNTYPPVWTYDKSAPRNVDDTYGGLNSVISVPSVSGVRMVFSVLVIGLFAALAFYTLIEPLIGWFLRIRLSFRLKLVFCVMLVGLFSNVLFMAYSVYELKGITRQGIIESVNLLHDSLLSQGVHFGGSWPKQEADALRAALRRFLWNITSRGSVHFRSNSQSMLQYAALFDGHFGIIAGQYARENEIRVNSHASAGKYTSVDDYFRYSVFADLIKGALKEGAPDTPRFNRRAGWSPLCLDYDQALVPIRVQDRVAGYYAVALDTKVYDDEISRIILTFLAMFPFILIVIFFLLNFIGGQVVGRLRDLTEWTRAIIRGDFSIEKRIRTNDEIEDLAVNFDTMRVSFAGNFRNTQLLNLITGNLQKLADIDDLFKVLLFFITANFGFAYNRAAIFLRNGSFLEGRYAIGSLDEKEMDETFGSYQDYVNLKVDVNDFIRDYRSYIGGLKGRYLSAVRQLRVPLEEGGSVFRTVFRESSAVHVGKDEKLHDRNDREIRVRLNLPDFVLLPVPKGKETVGVLLLDNYFHKNAITAENVSLLQILLNDFAVNLENAYILKDLEARVAERTGELEDERRKVVQKTVELERERNELKIRNEIIENEIAMARQIQDRMIPGGSPRGNVFAMHREMQEIGGDFYDYIRFRDDRLGIFVSDVSGHGVPAAFITSMIKSFILQAGDQKLNPSAMLYYLNGLLSGQLAGNFITALYGIYDPAARTFQFSNAGHNPPYIIRGGAVRRMEVGIGGLPLGILSNDEVDLMDKGYKNHVISFDGRGKLMLYTDGLVEAVRISQKLPFSVRRIDFEEGGLMEALEKCKDLPCEEFVKSVYGSLVEFRGSEDFDDDVCVICIDVE